MKLGTSGELVKCAITALVTNDNDLLISFSNNFMAKIKSGIN